MFLFQSLHIVHWPQVRAIYLEGIATGQATFQQSAPSWEEWDRGHLPHSRIVALIDNKVAGWAALSHVSTRPVYKGVAEVSVYVAEMYRGNGLGFQLLRQLVQESEQNGIWTLQSSIFPENTASVRIHEQNGFRIMGRRERIAQMNGIWRDTIIMERRSKIVGN
ncbi:GNAT family N-acetyltransferase [Chitinophagaceae bacterium LB-8]|uniref:GNAT family N-acetyltransferase n=1 Tax=Paraflavisolibacter caeni TaxID=2982496 RepID=A0A9X2XUU4_9BACT|nr:GNAT family N-acetyltransferase [Paraflavisolibacter caeni]MCU7548193.1 GNAT family N-acetyltransferase [Paraflavisolibacter caeni]